MTPAVLMKSEMKASLLDMEIDVVGDLLKGSLETIVHMDKDCLVINDIRIVKANKSSNAFGYAASCLPWIEVLMCRAVIDSAIYGIFWRINNLKEILLDEDFREDSKAAVGGILLICLVTEKGFALLELP